MISKIFKALEGVDHSDHIQVVGEGDLSSWFDVTGLAVGSIAAACAQIASLHEGINSTFPVIVDRRLASMWFSWSLRPDGWEVPNPWDAIAGDYQTSDGWIKLHTNAPLHRIAALKALGLEGSQSDITRNDVQHIVLSWSADELEQSICEAGGCAAVMRNLESWYSHPQGIAVAQEPLIDWRSMENVEPKSLPSASSNRPLEGVRVLDLTRVLAGPVAGRVLAGFGAQVLRIDPPSWDEPAVIPEIFLGKRCAGLDLHNDEDRKIFADLIRGTDILLHGYRPGALDMLGFSSDVLRVLKPNLIDVTLSAYGWTGPWRGRRGFDSLVQMSSGIAAEGMERSKSSKPNPLPVQALDHATGYLMAASAVNALKRRAVSGDIYSARLSLARTAHLLISTLRDHQGTDLLPEKEEDIALEVENTDWGPARRLKFPAKVTSMMVKWDHPARKLRSASPQWV